jgi:hypothetical protein
LPTVRARLRQAAASRREAARPFAANRVRVWPVSQVRPALRARALPRRGACGQAESRLVLVSASALRRETVLPQVAESVSDVRERPPAVSDARVQPRAAVAAGLDAQEQPQEAALAVGWDARARQPGAAAEGWDVPVRPAAVRVAAWRLAAVAAR